MFQYTFYFTHYPRKEEITKLLENKKKTFLNYYVDVKGTLPKLFDEKFFKFLVNLSSDDLHRIIVRSVNHFIKYFGYLLNSAYDFNLFPRIFLFYETGESRYHKQIDTTYKSSRFEPQLLTESEMIRAGEIRHLILQLVKGIANLIPNMFCIHWKYFEADVVPHYLLSNFSKLRSDDNLNVIFSNDKDMFQTLKFPDTYQIVFRNKTRYIVDDSNAWKILIKKPEDNSDPIPSRFIPFGLAVAGDDADCVSGVKGLGYIKLYRILQKHLERIKDLPDSKSLLNYFSTIKLSNKDEQKIVDNLDLIEKNLKLVDFEIIQENIPITIKTQTLSLLRENIEKTHSLDELKKYLNELLKSDEIDLSPLKTHFQILSRR